MLIRTDDLFTLSASGDGSPYKRIFSIAPDNAIVGLTELPTVTLENLKLKLDYERHTDGSIQASPIPMDGGCMFVKSARLTLRNVIFEGCAASGRGGGLFIVRRFATLYIILPRMSFKFYSHLVSIVQSRVPGLCTSALLPEKVRRIEGY